jgi:hypothetical protein
MRHQLLSDFVVLLIKHERSKIIAKDFRLLCGWRGESFSSDHWRLNSGIVSVDLNDESYMFNGSSGSIYVCHKSNYGMTPIMEEGLRVIKSIDGVKSIYILEDQDWSRFNCQ